MKLVSTSDLHHGWTSKTSERLEAFFDSIIEKEGDFILCVSGDLITAKQESFKKCLKLLRRKFGDRSVLIVRGNHDYYNYNHNKQQREYPPVYLEAALLRHSAVASDQNIHLLTPDNPYISGSTVIMGFDGWHYDAEENYKLVYGKGDKAYEHLLLRGKEDLQKILQTDISNYHTKVLVTHFPPYTCDKEDPSVASEKLEELTYKFDYILCGHTHQPHDEVINGCRVLNAGSGAQYVKNSVVEQWKYITLSI